MGGRSAIPGSCRRSWTTSHLDRMVCNVLPRSAIYWVFQPMSMRALNITSQAKMCMEIWSKKEEEETKAKDIKAFMGKAPFSCLLRAG